MYPNVSFVLAVRHTHRHLYTGPDIWMYTDIPVGNIKHKTPRYTLHCLYLWIFSWLNFHIQLSITQDSNIECTDHEYSYLTEDSTKKFAFRSRSTTKTTFFPPVRQDGTTKDKRDAHHRKLNTISYFWKVYIAKCLCQW